MLPSRNMGLFENRFPPKKGKRKLIHRWLAMIYPNLSQSRIVFQLIMGCATWAFVAGTDQDSPPQSPGERLREKDAGLHTHEIPRKTGVMCSHVFSPKVSIIVHDDMLCNMYTEEGLNMMVASMYKHPAESQATMPQKGVMHSCNHRTGCHV